MVHWLKSVVWLVLIGFWTWASPIRGALLVGNKSLQEIVSSQKDEEEVDHLGNSPPFLPSHTLALSSHLEGFLTPSRLLCQIVCTLSGIWTRKSKYLYYLSHINLHLAWAWLRNFNPVSSPGWSRTYSAAQSVLELSPGNTSDSVSMCCGYRGEPWPSLGFFS